VAIRHLPRRGAGTLPPVPPSARLTRPGRGAGVDPADVLLVLDGDRPLTVGRGPACDLDLDGDDQVSRLHAELLPIGDWWVISDDGLSRNGTWVDGERVSGRRRLRDGDVLRFGGTEAVFSLPGAAPVRETRQAPTTLVPELTATQRAVLVALARPFADASAFARPASNRDIADEVHLSVDAVKGHLRTLAGKFALGDLPQNEKRLRLVEEALRTGALSRSELR